MTDEPYRVEYDVVFATYLEQGGELSGPDFARLWAGTRIFGKHRGVGAFWRTNSAGLTKQSKIDLGSLELVQPLLDQGPQPIFGGGSFFKSNVARFSTIDGDFDYAHSEASRCFGYETLPYLQLTVSGQWFERTGPELVLEKLHEHFQVCDRYSPPYGLIDISDAEDCYGGIAYTPIFFQNCRLHRYVEHEKWLHACSTRRDQARNVYWGNYFGPGILERLGGKKSFADRYRQQSRIADGKSSALIWDFPNGLFVSLCHDPLACKPCLPLDGSAANNLHWLLYELGSNGVLNPYAAELEQRANGSVSKS